MSTAICEHGHVSHVRLRRGFRLQDARCGECGSPLHMAQFNTATNSYVARSPAVQLKIVEFKTSQL